MYKVSLKGYRVYELFKEGLSNDIPTDAVEITDDQAKLILSCEFGQSCFSFINGSIVHNKSYAEENERSILYDKIKNETISLYIGLYSSIGIDSINSLRRLALRDPSLMNCKNVIDFIDNLDSLLGTIEIEGVRSFSIDTFNAKPIVT